MKTDFDRPPTLTSAVTDTVRRAILAGELHPGEPLREVELSHTLNVSRGTVREAVRELQDYGLIEVQHRHRGDQGHTSNAYRLLTLGERNERPVKRGHKPSEGPNTEPHSADNEPRS